VLLVFTVISLGEFYNTLLESIDSSLSSLKTSENKTCLWQIGDIFKGTISDLEVPLSLEVT